MKLFHDRIIIKFHLEIQILYDEYSLSNIEMV